MSLLERIQSKSQSDGIAGNIHDELSSSKAEKIKKIEPLLPDGVKPAVKQKRNNSEKKKANDDYQELKILRLSIF